MLRSLYTAATGMEAQQLKMDVTAHNLANTSTTGFKKERAEFEDLMSEQLRAPGAANGNIPGAPTGLEVGLGVRPAATTRSFAQGDFLNTQNPLDVAIEGTGFFAIRQPSGELAYTRAGNLRVDAGGRLVTQNGDPFEPDITIPPDALNVTIDREGVVSVRVPGRDDMQEVGQLELTTFANPGGLTSVGRNLLIPSAASGDAQRMKPGEQGTGTIAQGYLENSNVEAVEEMISMITTQRAYELNSKVITTADQMLQRLTNLR